MPRRREGGDLCAIFIHAGAGFHSRLNEKIHLAAVNDAALVAMAVLKNGGSATDAVEMAIRLLEDKEITNAGYGSNLTMDGSVECDATLVDYKGRSGAVGAMAQVKNPIAAARIVLDESIKPLTLSRVPPNLLVGAGATDFAHAKGLPILPPDFLVSAGARDRWMRWKQDLRNVEDRASRTQTLEQRPASGQLTVSPKSSRTRTANQTAPPERQSDLPSISSVIESVQDVPAGSTLTRSREDRSSLPNAGGTVSSRASISTPDNEADNDSGVDDNLQWLASPPKRQKMSGPSDGSMDFENPLTQSEACLTTKQDSDENEGREDDITDTVGAIAVDCFGRIAAGSSSGGIGMKRKGRCGPAALVGVGTAVIPVDPDDLSETSVATLTSGTGEHMAITSAAAIAAERIYTSTRKRETRLERCNEDEALHAVITRDFLQHPGVASSPCQGAIGILAVKKTRDGIYFYFGHSTESFVIASMHSEERRPVCTMSRNNGPGSIAQGGRVSRSRT
ncbi:hypothetical protein PV08_01524 [Exophiala spinifera]|uniref:Uncharacterized protein n=1 Tax=Exophiala spinifera TaxID=91928 RepID=A0A0D2BR86_9EURO|nr:uncharacterized protein PV08_01524 [Exophiala spinifera]KIW20945.1 hypothetical protein PV08_01524 [Exophiala spinifera]